MQFFINFYVYFFCFVTVAVANNWKTYPSVKKTASINGFADPLYDKLPKCAEECVKQSTGNTPCPKWDTGCLCIMPQWSGLVAECIAKNCKGKDVDSAESLAFSLCDKVGASKWEMPASISDRLHEAAGGKKAKATATGSEGSGDDKSVSPQSTAKSNSAKATGSSNSSVTSSASKTGNDEDSGAASSGFGTTMGTIGSVISLVLSWVFFM